MQINLISDTVTKPTPGMLDAMMAAVVGDDVFKEAIDLSKISLPSEFTLEDARKKLNE